MDTLINTFAENRDALASEKIFDTTGSFAVPMMTIAELKKSLDTEIARINVPGMLDAFMVLLVQNEEEWIQEDENKISRMVTEFFANTAFNGFANKTITSFLKDKYENKLGGKITDEQLTGFIYNDWMKLLTKNATRLFGFNKAIWSENKTAMNPYIAFPAISVPIRTAAVQMKQTDPIWDFKESMFTDRIYVTYNMMGFPLSSYIYCADYEYMCFSSKEYGRHYYEGKPLRGIGFTDWNELPSITPQSMMDVAHAPEDVVRMVTKANNLYERALALGILDDEGYFYEADKNHLVCLNTACDVCEIAIARVRNEQDEYVLQQKIECVKGLLRIPMIRIGKLLRSDGSKITKELIYNIQKDYFFASPALHETVRAKVELVEKWVHRVNTLITASEEKKQYRIAYNRNLYDFCEALLTGVITIDGRIIAYNRVIDGNEKAIILNKRGEEYPFSNIPLYQGFLSYQKLEIDVKNEIKKLVCDRLADDAPEIYSVGNKLKTYFSEERFDAFGQLASLYKDCSEIIAFIRDVRGVMNDFFHERGI